MLPLSYPGVATATVAISREADRMRGLESLPSVVREDDPKEVFSVGTEPERDEGIIAERRGQHELADLRVSVEDVHPVQVEGLGGLDELPLPNLQPRSARMPGLDLDVDGLAGADAAVGDQLRDPDRWRANLVGARATGRRCGPGAATRAVGDRDGPRGMPARLATAVRRHHAQEAAPGLEPRPWGDLRAHRRPESVLVAARIELGPSVRPVDVRLQRLHGVPVGIDLHSFVWLLDAPVDHVPERRELVDLLLELGELVGMVVRSEGMAHGAGHPGLGKGDTELLLGRSVPVEEQITDLDLLHENLVEGLELLQRVLLLVGQRP